MLIISCNPNSKKNAEVSIKAEQNSLIPEFASNYLNKQMPNWKLHSFPKSHGSKILIDLNCDGKEDFAGIFQDSVGNYKLIKIVSLDEHYIHFDLVNFGKDEPRQIDFSLLSPGSTYRRFDSSIQVFDCGALETNNRTENTYKIFYGDSVGRSFVIVHGK